MNLNQMENKKEPNFFINVDLEKIKIKEEIEDIYVYIDYFKEKIECRYNDEKIFPINLENKIMSYLKISRKEVFKKIKDITVEKIENKIYFYFYI